MLPRFAVLPLLASLSAPGSAIDQQHATWRLGMRNWQSSHFRVISLMGRPGHHGVTKENLRDACRRKRTHPPMSTANRRSRSLVPWILGAIASLATGNAGAEPAQLPALEPTTIEVDITALPASEKAALARIVHAGRLMD